MTAFLRERPYRIIAGLFALCLLVQLAAIPIPRHLPGMLFSSDGIHYYMYTRSMVMDGDLHFENEHKRLVPWESRSVTATGYVPNMYAIGTGLLWTPFFAAAHVLSVALTAMGLAVDTEGYGMIYQASVMIGSMIYGFLGLVLLFRTARALCPRTALPAVLLVWFATNLIYYMVGEPSMSHMCSFFAAALFAFLWLRDRPPRSLSNWFLLGLSGGLIALVRQPDVTWIALPVLDSFLSGKQTSLRKTLAGLAVFSGAFLLVFSLQMGVWHLLYGNPFMSGYAYEVSNAFDWFNPQVGLNLLSFRTGFFSGHPLMIFACAGLWFLFRREPRLAALIAAGFCVQVFLISAWTIRGDSFGNRMLTSSLPWLTLGLASLLEALNGRKGEVLAWTLGLALVLWNGLSFVQYRFEYLSPHATTFTLRDVTIGKFDMIRNLGERIHKMTIRLEPKPSKDEKP